MAVGRPISSLGPTFSKMGNVAAKANVEAVERSTRKLGAVVTAQGSRFHIKGRSGSKVPLSAKTDVRGFNNRASKVVVTGAVRGIPEGFWNIVEHGSGAHLITQRGSRTTRTGKQVGRKYAAGKTLRLFSEGHGFSDLRPVGNAGSGFGPYQWVMHPGHGTIGRPWEAAMTIGRPLVANEMAYEETRALTKAFVKSL